MRIHVDFETDSLNQHFAQIIEGYFVKPDGEAYHLKCKPFGEWSKEAEKIHHISRDRAWSYGHPRDELAKLLQWLPNSWNMVCFANKNHFYENSYTFRPFDHGVLASNIMWHLGYPSFINYELNVGWETVHDKAKQMLDLGVDSEGKKIIYSQENVAKYFKIKYNPHDAREDVLAMIEIEKRLDEMNASRLSKQERNDKNLTLPFS